MTTKELMNNMSDTFDACLHIVEKKNHDYAGDTDAFKNFRYSTLVGVSEDRAILVRMTDKLARISNLLDKDPMVAGESITDTLLDLINYTAILKALMEEKNDLPMLREGIHPQK